MKTIKIKGMKMKRKYRERGQVLLIVLVLLLFLAGSIIGATLTFVGTSLKTNQVYDNNAISTDSAEAGIQDAICKIENYSSTNLNNFFSSTTPLPPALTNPPNPIVYTPPNSPYSDYDYSDTWGYVLPNSPATGSSVNNQTVNVYMQNVWIPSGITPPTPALAQQIFNNNNLTVAGTAGSAPYYNVSIDNNDPNTSDPSLSVTSIGVWLPQGFTYVPNSLLPSTYNYTEQVVPCAGNAAVIWSFPGTLSLAPGGSLSFTLQYSVTTSTTNYPTALSWVTVNPNTSFPYAYTWDFGTIVHLLTADAGNTQIQCYSPKSQTRCCPPVYPVITMLPAQRQ